MPRVESELTGAQISLQRKLYGTPRMPPKVMPECLACRGTGWVWSTEIPGLRKRCDDCRGTGQKGDINASNS